jgi:hypothetical protein
MNHTREVISLWERNHTQHKLFAQNENGIMNNDANCSFAILICAGKVLVRGPRISPVQKDSQSLCSRNGFAHERVLLGH